MSASRRYPAYPPPRLSVLDQFCPLTRKITGSVKMSPVVGDARRRRRHRVGASQHCKRCLVEGGFTRSLARCWRKERDLFGRLEADHDFRRAERALGGIPLEPGKVGGKLLPPRGSHPLRVIAGARRRGDGAGSLDCGRAARRRPSLLDATTRSTERLAPCRSSVSSLTCFASTGATSRSGSSVSMGVSFGKSVTSATDCCSTTAGDAIEASASGPGGSSVASRRGELHSIPISMARAPTASSSWSGCR